MSDKLVPIILELNVKENKRLDESFLRMFGGLIKMLMQRMFGMPTPPITIRGTEDQIDSLKQALSYEKKYMETFYSLGLDNPQTYRSKAQLDKAVAEFERRTGLKWPFK
jgi:type III secretory pathway component EscV